MVNKDSGLNGLTWGKKFVESYTFQYEACLVASKDFVTNFPILYCDGGISRSIWFIVSSFEVKKNQQFFEPFFEHDKPNRANTS